MSFDIEDLSQCEGTLQQSAACSRAEPQSQAAPSVLEHRVAVFAVPKSEYPIVTCLLDQYHIIKIPRYSQQIRSV